MTRLLLALVVLLLAVAPAAAEDPPARNADAWCGAHPGEVLVLDARGIWHRIADDLPRQDDEGRLTQTWRGDLDGDGRRDLILRDVGGCGTRECPIEAFVSCADGTFSRVLEPQYGDGARVTKAKRGWASIELRTVGESGSRPRYHFTAYGFGAAGYRP